MTQHDHRTRVLTAQEPTTPTTTTPATARSTQPVPGDDAPVRRLARVLRIELRDELLAILREPTALFFSVAMPVAFFAMFVALFGRQEAAVADLPIATTMLATFGTFGVLGVALLNPGVGVADDRERGWLRAKRVSATPLPLTLVAKCLAIVPYAVGVLVGMTAIAAASGSLELGSGGTWLRLCAVLVVGALPFGLIGLAVGLLATPNATTAILQAVFIPTVVASGLWFPLDQMPGFVQRLAEFLPPYHLSRLALAQLDGGPVLTHVLALVATTGVGAVCAGLAYRRTRP